MKKLLLFCLIISPLFSLAQTTPQPAKATAPHDVYCMLIASDKIFSNSKVSINVDYGQDPQFIDQKTRDENTKVTTYNTIVDALNFMALRGWAIANTYVVTTRGVSVYYYVMKLPVADLLSK